MSDVWLKLDWIRRIIWQWLSDVVVLVVGIIKEKLYRSGMSEKNVPAAQMGGLLRADFFSRDFWRVRGRISESGFDLCGILKEKRKK